MQKALINMRNEFETHDVACQQWREEAGSVLVLWILLSESGGRHTNVARDEITLKEMPPARVSLLGSVRPKT